MDYVVEVVTNVAARAKELKGLRITEQPKALRHFSARFTSL
jgi:tryptophanase